MEAGMKEIIEEALDLEDNPHMLHQLDASYKNLDRTLGSITMADNKALIALTFQGAIVAGLALIAGSVKDALDRQHNLVLTIGIGICLTAFFICFCVATLRLFQTISPRKASSIHPSDHPSFLFFFGGIAAMHPDAFAQRMRTITPHEIHEGLLIVTHNNARIAAQKMDNLHTAYFFLGMQMLFYVFIVVLSVLPTHVSG